ncbi:unnamed protein product [Coregonus sp. 'balchen']|nr:unnamed protein product [Coregonus sp. 'balchen']
MMKRKPNQHQPPNRRGRVSASAGGQIDSPDNNTMTDSETVPLPPSQKRHLTMMQHGDNLLKFLNEDRTKQRFCDVSVSVGGKCYSAHKAMLAHGSSYFHAELTKNPNADHVILDHVEDSVFQHLLRLLYTAECVISESEVPALTEAAGFLDMMDVVKLLAGEGDVRPALARVEVKSVGEPSAGKASKASDLPSDCVGVQSPVQAGAHHCSFCSRTFCYKKSMENHLTRNHSSSTEGDAREKVVTQEITTTVTTNRRSARRRKVPAKLERGDADSAVATEGKLHHDPASRDPTTTEEDDEEEEEEEEEGRKPKHKSDTGDALTPTEGEEAEEEREEDEEEMVVERKSALVRGARESGESSEVETTEHQTVNEVEVYSQAADGSNYGPVYPEGLAPVIIQSVSKKTLKCPKCDKTFDRTGKYESHTRVHTGEKPFQCDVCLQCYSTKSNLTVHKKKHASDAPFQKKDHKFHPDHIQEFLAMRKKKNEGWKCDICHKSFTRRPHLEEHMILHTQDRPFKCAFCDDYFKSRFARLKHQEKYHLGPFPCDICGRQFNDTGNRKRHIECTHGGKRKWTCFICGKSVRERTTLREHMRIHSGEKPHLCSICGQSFRHGSSYRLHLRVHHDDKRYECDECGKTFIRHDHLTKHQKIHSGEKAHQCEECGKCFRRHDHLTVHYKSVHLGEKVWQKCPVCQQTFRIKKTLTKHMVIHSDARPFNCPHCSATFKRKDKLKYHRDHVHSAKYTEQQQPLVVLTEDKMVTLPYNTHGPSKVYRAEPKTVLQNVPSDVCVPVTLVPVQMSRVVPGVQGDLGGHVTCPPQGQGQQQTAGGYQNATELAFLEKYTLTPQPANIVHPVRPDQMLDPRDQSYLGTLLGLDSATPVQNISNSDHVAH